MTTPQPSNSTTPTPAPAPPPQPVPKRAVALWTIPWVALLFALLLNAILDIYRIPHEAYATARLVAIVSMLILGVVGLLMSLNLVGSHTADPWYRVPLLVALVLFWGLFPPCWFFVEYLSFDKGAFQFPTDLQAAIAAAEAKNDMKTVNELKGAFMTTTKTYADLAAKVWGAVGLALGTSIGLARR